MNFDIGAFESNKKVQMDFPSEHGWYRGLSRPIMILCGLLWDFLCALRRTFLTGESPQSALVVGRIQPRPRVSIVRWNLKEGGGKSLV